MPSAGFMCLGGSVIAFAVPWLLLCDGENGLLGGTGGNVRKLTFSWKLKKKFQDVKNEMLPRLVNTGQIR